MNAFASTRVDYVAILEALLKTTAESEAINGGPMAAQPGVHLSDLKTIGFMVGRQCGKSYAMLDWNRNHPMACLNIVMNGSLRRHFSKKAEDRDNKDKIGPILDSDKLRQCMATYRKDKDKGVEELRRFHAKPDFVIVDDASVFFSYLGVKRREFYEFIAAAYGIHPFVICLG